MMKVIVEGRNKFPHRCPPQDKELTDAPLRTIAKCTECGKVWWAAYYNLAWRGWKPLRWYHWRLNHQIIDAETRASYGIQTLPGIEPPKVCDQPQERGGDWGEIPD